MNLSDLERFEAGQAVTPGDAGGGAARRGATGPSRSWATGEVGKALTVSAHKFSAGAQAKIEAAGGRCEVIPR